MKKAEDADIQGSHPLIEQDVLEKAQQQLWAEARRKHQEQTQALANYRKQSLSTSHQKRVAILREKIAQATDANIQRMRRSELDKANADYQRRIQEFETAAAKADVTTGLVAYGILEVKGGA